MNYKETLHFLYEQLPAYQNIGKRAFKKDLNNIRAICKILDEPHLKFKSIHVAGTNGKGSTSHLLASVFQEAGYKTGLYTSPHLLDFRERIRINGKMIAESEVIAFVKQHQSDFNSIRPSFFEWTVGLAFYYFAKSEVDIAIIETGLGGRLDSTNILKPILSVITNIGFDHMDMLGDTLDQIASEKAGIIKPNVPIVIGNSSGQKAIFEQKAKLENAEIFFSDEIAYPKLATDLKGIYQRENIRTAYTALSLLKNQYSLSEEHILNGFAHVVSNTHLRGRWDLVKKDPKVILETAHNFDGIRMVVEQLKQENYKQLYMILAFVKGKDLKVILQLLPKDAIYILTQANIDRRLDLDTLGAYFKNQDLNYTKKDTIPEAIQWSIDQASKEDLIYIGGSNFTVAEALDFFQ